MRHGSMPQRIPAGSKWVQVCGNKALSLLMYMQEFQCCEFHNINLVWSAYVSAPPPRATIWSPSGLWERQWLPILSSPVVPTVTVHMKATFHRREILLWGELCHLWPTSTSLHTYPKFCAETKITFCFFLVVVVVWGQDWKDKLLFKLSIGVFLEI